MVQQFSGSFKLPDNAKPDDIAAHLDKGVLSVYVPKLPPVPKPQPKHIDIVVQSSTAHACFIVVGLETRFSPVLCGS